MKKKAEFFVLNRLLREESMTFGQHLRNLNLEAEAKQDRARVKEILEHHSRGSDSDPTLYKRNLRRRRQVCEMYLHAQNLQNGEQNPEYQGDLDDILDEFWRFTEAQISAREDSLVEAEYRRIQQEEEESPREWVAEHGDDKWQKHLGYGGMYFNSPGSSDQSNFDSD